MITAITAPAIATLVPIKTGRATGWLAVGGSERTMPRGGSELDCVRILRSDGTVEAFAGVCGESGYAGDGGPATEALFADPSGVAVDANGNVYVADTGNHLIRKIVPLR